MFVEQKSQEVSYALIRIAPYIRRKELKSRIERLAFKLLEDSAAQDLEEGIKSVSALNALVSMGKAIYEIEPINAKVILGELNLLKSSMRNAIGLSEGDEETPNLESFFSKPPAVVDEGESGKEAKNGNGMAGTIRQSAILEKIRQTGNKQIQLKDLLSEFPEVSERTMRYDLQKLCSQGLVERVGSGGPGSYYSLKT